MTKIVELRQDRNLIRNNFDGYKLSLDAVPVIRQALSTPPYKALLNDDQYSLLHTEMFSMQNLLQCDPWERNNAYFVNRLGEVIRTGYNEQTGRPDALQVVYRLPEVVGGADGEGQRRSHGDYNYSMRFVSEKYCVLCDGIRHVLLLDTGNRLKAPEWQEVAKTAISAQEERNFMLYDCRLDTIQEQKEISLALGRVQGVETAGNIGVSHYLHLHWAKWICKDASWSFSILDTLEGKGSLYYCAFEPRAQSLILSSNKEFKFRSQKETACKTSPNVEHMPHMAHGEAMEVGGFEWSQTNDDVIIKFNEKMDKEKADYKIVCTSEELNVKCGDEKLLDHALFSRVDKDLTTWTIENNFLQITLVKERSLYWPLLLADGAGPKESTDNGNAICLPIEQKPIVNLEAPIEECDFPMNTIEDEVKIERFHLPTKTITHTVMLGSNPPLFTTCLRPGFPMAIATRQDVDASLWLQVHGSTNPEEWSLRHEGNLHAFGYVQASKQQKKFIDCSPDLSYSLICETHRHIFLYKASYNGANGLRNRSGPQVSLGKQHLITLDDAGEVLGLTTAPSVITLLTASCVLYVQMI